MAELHTYPIPDTLIVHPGVFHADDVITAAMLKQLNPDLTILRLPADAITEEMKNDHLTLIADVGGGRYDHHQADAELRPNGNKYAACGLVLRDYKDRLFPEGNVPETFSETLDRVQDTDNGVPNTKRSFLSILVNLSNPVWDSQQSQDEAFTNAVDVMREHFVQPFVEKGMLPQKDWEHLVVLHDAKNKEEREASLRAKEIVERALQKSDGRVVELPFYVPWQEYLCQTDAVFVTFPPTGRDGWLIQCIPPDPKSFDKKVPLPESWLTDPPKGVTFVHQARFLASCEDKRTARELAETAWKAYEKEQAIQKKAALTVPVSPGSKAVVDHVLENRKEEINTIYSEIRCIEPLVTMDVKHVTEQLGTHCTGLQYAMKTASSVEDKLQREKKEKTADGKSFNEAESLLKCKDLIRYTEICPHDKLVATTENTIHAMEEKGYVLSGVKNYYQTPYNETQYMGLHLNFISPYGQEIELQVHSEESFDAKQRGHALYEEIRSVTTPEARKNELKEEIVVVHQSIERPPAYESIKNFTMDEQEKLAIQEERRAQVEIERESREGDTIREAEVYTVTIAGAAVLTGYEVTFSDQSAWTYRNPLAEEKQPTLSLISEKGDAFEVYPSNPHTPSIEQVMAAGETQEQIHVAWMEKNMHGKTLEDLDLNKEDMMKKVAELADKGQTR